MARMTPDEEVLRNAWLAELWTVCREWHQSKDERLDARARNEKLAGQYGEADAEPEVA